MTDTDITMKQREVREKIVRDQVERALARISDTVRYTALGQIGAAYALIVSNTPFSTGMMRENSTLIFVVLAFGCCALVFELFQYFVTFFHGLRLAEHPDLDAGDVGGHGFAWLVFWLKIVVASIGMALFVTVFVKSVYFSSHQSAAGLDAPQVTISAAASGTTGCAKQRATN
jgi:tellurite resistance protein TehA-like permease